MTRHVTVKRAIEECREMYARAVQRRANMPPRVHALMKLKNSSLVGVGRPAILELRSTLRKSLQASPEPGAVWVTIAADRALYADHGRDVILCDRIPTPATLVLLLTPEQVEAVRTALPSPQVAP
jgi:hypothetical protein